MDGCTKVMFVSHGETVDRDVNDFFLSQLLSFLKINGDVYISGFETFALSAENV